MSTFQSSVTLNKPVSEVYNFLADLNNHQQLMGDNVLDWGSTYDTMNFNVQNMIKLYLKVETRIENQEIKIVPAEKPPFDMELTWTLTNNKAFTTEVTFIIKADLNMMMKVLASGPLQKLTDQETQNLSVLLS